MTGPYDWNPMPHTVDTRCPTCGEAAVFEFAEVVRIRHLTGTTPYSQPKGAGSNATSLTSDAATLTCVSVSAAPDASATDCELSSNS